MATVMKGLSGYVPDYVLTNEKLTELVETSDEWIREHSGIETRHISKDENCWELGVKAGREAIEKAGLSPLDIDLILCTTVTPDYFTPNTACCIQAGLGCKNAAAMDLSAACTGFIYALDTADAFIQSKKYKNILVVSAEVLSRMTDYTDRGTCILFGDGAAAAVLCEGEGRGVLATFLMADGTKREFLEIPAFVAEPGLPWEKEPRGPGFLKMDGHSTFKKAISAMADATNAVLQKAGLTLSDVDWFVPHQANLRIIKSYAERNGIPLEKFGITIHKYGNTSSASIPLCFADLQAQGKIKKGQLCLLLGFGGGFTYGAALVEA